MITRGARVWDAASSREMVVLRVEHHLGQALCEWRSDVTADCALFPVEDLHVILPEDEGIRRGDAAAVSVPNTPTISTCNP